MKRILLTQGKEALVSDEDYVYLRRWVWQVTDNGWGNEYAQSYTSRSAPGGRKFFRMHVLIARRMGLPKGNKVDHRNGNGLDNRRSNLRPATTSENGGNRIKQRNNKSGYKGVSKSKQKWLAQLRRKGKDLLRERFDTKIEAARAYNRAAIEHFGEFAALNPV